MNPDRERRHTEREPKQRADDRDDSSRTTPAADMQPEDASTADTESASTEDAARPDARDSAGGTPADAAMKQEHKTSAGR
jgi:hypothetical protein